MGKKDKAEMVPAAGSRALTPLDIQQKEFAVSRLGGYKMRDVDEFLDQLTDAMTALTAENERLRQGQGSSRLAIGGPDLDDTQRQADEILSRARDEAARIVAKSKESAASSGGAVAAGAVSTGPGPDERAAINRFLMQERAFLQSLAGLVQGHAEDVKGMAREVKASNSPTSAASTSAALARSAAGPQAAASTVAAPPTTPTTTPAAATTAGEASPRDRSEARPKQAAPDVAKPADDVAVASERSDPATPMNEDASREATGSSTSPRSTTPSDTRPPASEETILIEEPQPATTSSRRDEDAAEGSLRELFWGED